MRVGIDAMGGDYAPKNEVLGAIEAYSEVKPGTTIVLFGDQEKINSIADSVGFDISKIEVVHTTEVIGMSDHPAKAFSQKADSSISVGFKHLNEGKIDGFASAGNTGAMLVGVMYTVKVIEGISRPCISSMYPLMDGTTGLLADVGLNADCKPDHLFQFAWLSSIYAKEVMGIENPRVALLNIGSEAEKGNLLAKATYELMAGTDKFNFVGNIEGYHLFSGKIADVIIGDGFVGNVVLKMAEGFYRIALKEKASSTFFNRLNYEIYGGTPVLGVNAPVVVGHGSSSPLAIKNMIIQTQHIIEVGLINKVKEALK